MSASRQSTIIMGEACSGMYAFSLDVKDALGHLHAFRHRQPIWIVYGPENEAFPGKTVAWMYFQVPRLLATNEVVVGESMMHLVREMTATRQLRWKGTDAPPPALGQLLPA